MGNLVINVSSIQKNSEGKIYKDIKLPLTNKFEANYDINAIKQSIRNIFSWRRGQRILDPLFGNIIYEYVYEPINNLTIKNLREAVLNMLKYEPRIDVIDLEIYPNNDQNTINVKLQYLIPKLNRMESFQTEITIVSS